MRERPPAAPRPPRADLRRLLGALAALPGGAVTRRDTILPGVREGQVPLDGFGDDQDDDGEGERADRDEQADEADEQADG